MNKILLSCFLLLLIFANCSKTNLEKINSWTEKEEYEKIFNHLTTYEDMLCSYYLFDTSRKLAQISYEDSLTSNLFHLIALFKTAFAKYLKTKFNDNIQLNRYIIGLYKKDDKIMIIKTFKFLSQFINKQIEVSHNPDEFLNHFLYSASQFQKILDKLEDEIIDIEGVTLD